MVVAGIRSLVEQRDYRKAFANCRTQRVDMNILYDHAPEQFMSNVPLFIDQVKKVSYLDLFLSSLRFEAPHLLINSANFIPLGKKTSPNPFIKKQG
jgi:elongator complex protein 1